MSQPVLTRRAVALGAAALALSPAAAFAQAPPPGSPDDPRPHSYDRIGAPAADFAFRRFGGGQARLGDYRGKTLILYFGGLWCPDCLADGAHVNRLAARAGADPALAFLNIHTRNRFGRWGPSDPLQPVTDPAEGDRALTAYFAETGYSYPVAFDPSRDWARENYAIAWYPSFLIIDRDDVIRAWRTDLGADGADAFLAQAQAVTRA